MAITSIFERFAAAFERAVRTDEWEPLAQYLSQDASYLNVGGPDPLVTGSDAVVAYLRQDVANTDRRFDSRHHEALEAPRVSGDALARRWRCTYTLAGAPDLVVEGEARYRFSGNLIQAIEEELTPAATEALGAWMAAYGDKLQGG